MGRALLGLLKGLIVGGAVGYGLLRLGAHTGLLAYLGCAITGALVGLLCGRAPWRADTIWTPVLKMLFGTLVGAGLYALGSRFLPGMTFSVQGVGDLGLRDGTILAPAIGLLYGLFVEVDDGGQGERDKRALEREKERKALGV
jgi:hypothetical protein